MRALVTGSAGFVGRHMAAELVARGWLVDGHDIVDHPLLDCMQTFHGPTPTYDLVVHCAARAPHRAAIDGQPAAGIYNRLLDAAMFDWAVRTGQRRVLYLSSSAVYPAAEQLVYGDCPLSEVLADPMDAGDVSPPFDTYGWAKLAGEQMAAQARAAGVPVTVVRPFSGYGEDQSEDFPFGAFVARARRREDPFTVWGSGEQVRDWIHVSDVVAGALAVAEAGVTEPVNLCTGIGTSMTELADLVITSAGYDAFVEYDLQASAGVAYRVGDPSRMREIYTPRVSLSEGVERAFAQVPA